MQEQVIARKLGLGSNFPRAIIYIRQNAVDVRLIKLKKAIAILAYKLHIGNLRVDTRITN